MSLQLLAKQMEAKGRKGDSMLVHMTPDEVAGLQKLAESAGGSLSVNPETGLVEAFHLKRLLPAVAGIAAGAVGGPMAGAAAGALVGGMTAPKKQREMGILMGALGGYGGAGIGAGLGAAGSTAAQATAMGAEATKQAGIAATQRVAQEAAIAEGAKVAGAEAAQTTAQQLAAEKLAQEAAADMARREAGAQAINQAGEKAAADYAAKSFAARTGEGIQALAGQPGRDAFFGQVGMKTAGMAAAPLMMAEERKPSETPTDNERYVYDFDYGRTGAERTPVASSAERTYFQPTYRRIFSAAEGGEVADAAPVDSGIAGGMSGASKAAFDYLMGKADSSAPQGIAAPAVRSAPVVGADNMYAFDPTTGAFIRNQNYVDPASGTRNAGLIGQLISGGNSDYTDPNPGWTNMSDAAKAAYYAENPTMGAITRAGQDLFGYTKLGIAQNYFAPGFAERQAAIASGVDPDYGMSYEGVASDLADAGYTDTGAYSDSPADTSDFGGDGSAGSDGGYAGYDSSRGDFAAGGLMGLAKGGMKSGGFVIPADVVSMVGEGNTDAGYKRIKSMVPGAIAIKGKDGGQADTVKTSIEGKQPARVAHGEMYVPPETVKRMGGAKKLYAMMDRVRQQATGSKKQIKPVNLRRAMA